MRPIRKAIIFVLAFVMCLGCFAFAKNSDVVFAAPITSCSLSQVPSKADINTNVIIPINYRTTSSVFRIYDSSNTELIKSEEVSGSFTGIGGVVVYQFNPGVAGTYKVVYYDNEIDLVLLDHGYEFVLTSTDTINIPCDANGSLLSYFQVYDSKGVLICESRDMLKDANYVDGEMSFDFLPTKAITYVIRYGYYDSNDNFVTITKDFPLIISGSKPSFEWPDNSEYIIPSTIDGDDVVILPNPTVIDENGDEIVGANIEIIVKDSHDNLVTLSDEVVGSTTYKKFSAAYSGDTLVEGYYNVIYKYQTVNDAIFVNEDYMIMVDGDYDGSEEIELASSSYTSTFKTSGVKGNEFVLPKPVVTNKSTGNSVDVHIDVTVQFIPSSTAESTTPIDMTVNDFTFTPIYDAKNGSYYKVVYTVTDFYGNTLTITPNAISDVTDTVAPVAIAVANYAVANIDDENFDDTNIDYLIPSKIRTGEIISIPAIYATDNFNSPSELQLYRTISLDGGTPTVLGSTVSNEAVNYTFETAGLYKLVYYAIDANGNKNKTITTYLITVTDDFTDTLEPNVVFDFATRYAFVGDTITFDSPTINDYATTDVGEQDIVTSRVNKTISYYINNDTNTMVVLTPNESGEYSFVVPSCTSLKIRVWAEDFEQNDVTVEKAVEIIDPTDILCPVSEDLSSYSGTYNEGDTIDIELEAFIDDRPQYLKGEVRVITPRGQSYLVSNCVSTRYETSDILRGIELDGGSILATLPGEYKIVYVATDIANNVTIRVSTFTVNDIVDPTFVNQYTDTTLQLGQQTTLQAPTAQDNGVEITNYSINPIKLIQTSSGLTNNYSFDPELLTFIAYEKGFYTFQAEVEDIAGNKTTQTFQIEVYDDVKPELNISDTQNFAKIYNELTTGLEVKLADFDPTDLSLIKEYKLTVTNPFGQVVKTFLNGSGITASDTGDYYKFSPTLNGVYTATYSATDKSGLTTTQTVEIYVGDYLAPKINVANSTTNAPTSMLQDAILTITLADITATDAKDGTITMTSQNDDDENLMTITLVGPDGSTITPTTTTTNYKYTMSSAGTYTLTITAKDMANNSAESKIYTILVIATDNSPLITTQQIGIILIVISCAILALVILYFIRTRNVKPTRPTPTKTIESK